MKIMQVTVQVGRVETASVEVLVLAHCEGEALAKQSHRCSRLVCSGRMLIGRVSIRSWSQSKD